MIVERERTVTSGLPMLLLLLAGVITCIGSIILVGNTRMPEEQMALYIILLIVLGIALLVCLRGLFIVNPNEAAVLQLFGAYVGSVKTAGFHWANPFYTRKHISQRVRNFESAKLKVNDQDGNPIEIAAVVVWKVVDTAEACFEVEDYQHYVHVQSEAALRNLATRYPYDAHAEGHMSLRANTAEVAEHLKAEIQARLTKAGVQVLESRISHLAYAPEIAMAMLRRQQASAVIAARQKIVEGAVGMVEMALTLLSKNKIVELDEERKAAMVSNLLVVLCGDRDTQPVVNTGTLHH